VSEPTLELRGTFLAVLEALREAGVAHAFIGALPVLAWGRVRATTDIDVVVSIVDDWQRLSAALARRGITQRKQISPADTADVLPDVAVCFSAHGSPVRVDVFIAKTDFERAVIQGAREATVLGTSVRLAAPEACIVYKLLARRPRDLDDIEAIFTARAAAGENLDWDFLDSWAEEWGITEELGAYRTRYGPGR
jgi:Nucleotidyl transferase of unknown function (DUF2204)